MDDVLSNEPAIKLSKDIADRIKGVMSQHNIEETHYKIKNALNIDEFADSVMNMVDEWTQNEYKENPKPTDKSEVVITQIYRTIAQCFVFDAKGKDHLNEKRDDLLLELQHWICNHCGNCNVNSYVDCSFTTDIAVCTLCGMDQIDQIVLKLRGHDCYTMVNDAHVTHCTIDSKQSDDESIDELIAEAINNDGAFNLLCPSQNGKALCGSILSLANRLIQYKRWLNTIHYKARRSIGKTVKVDPNTFKDPNTFRNTFMQCVKDIESITSITEDNMQTITELMQRDPQNVFDINTFTTKSKDNKDAFSQILQKCTKISTTSCNELYHVISKALQTISKTKPVDQNVFKQTFIEKAALIRSQTHLLTQMFEHNTDNIADIKLFAAIKQTKFGQLIRKNTTLRVTTGVLLCRNMNQVLKQIAQKEQFGQFLSDLDLDVVYKDYHHILDIHINHGTKETVKNVFRFFNMVVHYDESTISTQCRSITRKTDRLKSLNDHDTNHTKHQMKHTDDPKDIWELKHHYAQSQLDIIHCHLVHSDLQRELKRFGERYKQHYDDDEKYKDIDEHKSEEDAVGDKSKFITELSESETTQYGFGVNHHHPYLNPTYDSIHDELLLNTLHHLTVSGFQIVLVKAIKKHRNHIKRHNALKCQYYKKQYNIIRNDRIGLRHLFALIVYVDMTAFCTKFRSTYRKLSSEKEEVVTKKHEELYYYARSLYESIEFFGHDMTDDLTVYHGLNRILFFSSFTAYFNQPISSTRDLIIANNFSKGVGIILTLKAATEDLSAKHDKAKYLHVSWLSDYPNEDEYLFYGEHVKFKICNIHNVEKGESKGHSEALVLLNKFQKIVNNQDVVWQEGDGTGKKKIRIYRRDIDQIESLKTLITEWKNKITDTKYSDPFGKKLFNYFCEHQTQILIKNYVRLPPLLSVALFGDETAISFTEITKVFPRTKRIIFTELDIDFMTASVDEYLQSTVKYAKTTSKLSGHSLEKIKFKSKPQVDGKQNPTLEQKANKYVQRFLTYGWEAGYELSPENTHILSFTSRNITIPNKRVSIVYSPKEDQVPHYFMQVTSVGEDEFHVTVVADVVTDRKRRVFIKDMNHSENMQRIIIKKGEISGG
eukprot:32312_1